MEVRFSGEVESLRSSLVLLEKSTIDSLRHENEVHTLHTSNHSMHCAHTHSVSVTPPQGLRSQIKKLHENLKVYINPRLFRDSTHSIVAMVTTQEEMKKLESGLQLEMNLEKGRLREESTNLSQRIKDTHNRIETEVSSSLSSLSIFTSVHMCVCVWL